MRHYLRVDQKSQTSISISSMAGGSAAIFIILFALLIASSESKRSACWRYGHSCWGGHGKRSGGAGIEDNFDVGEGVGLKNAWTGASASVGVPFEKSRGKFLPFPVLSQMLLRHSAGGDSFLIPQPQQYFRGQTNIPHSLGGQITSSSYWTKPNNKRNSAPTPNRDEDGDDTSNSELQEDNDDTQEEGKYLLRSNSYEKSREGETSSIIPGSGSNKSYPSVFADNSIFTRNRKWSSTGKGGIVYPKGFLNNFSQKVSRI